MPEEFKYTKADLFSYYQRLEDKKITHTPQFSAGNFFIKKNEKTEQFIYKWLEVFEKRFDLSTLESGTYTMVVNAHDRNYYHTIRQ